MDVVLLHNQNSGNGDQSEAGLSALLQKYGYRPECVSLDEPWQDTDLLERGEFIVVAGGDGSLKRVATRLAHRRRPIAPLPMGTANNIATSVGIVGEPETIVAGWADGTRRAIDLGLARGPWGERHFIEAVGIGLIGRAIATLNAIDGAHARKFSRKEDKLYRDLCVLLTLANEMSPLPIHLTMDGKDRSGHYLMLEVLNISRAGPGYELASQANASDGCLNLVCVRADERAELIKSVVGCLRELQLGTSLSSTPLRHLQLRLERGEIRVDDEIMWSAGDADGPPEGIEVDLRVEPAALEFIVPKA